MSLQGLQESARWSSLVRTVGVVREAGFARFCKCIMLDVPSVDGE